MSGQLESHYLYQTPGSPVIGDWGVFAGYDFHHLIGAYPVEYKLHFDYLDLVRALAGVVGLPDVIEAHLNWRIFLVSSFENQRENQIIPDLMIPRVFQLHKDLNLLVEESITLVFQVFLLGVYKLQICGDFEVVGNLLALAP